MFMSYGYRLKTTKDYLKILFYRIKINNSEN